jgi:MoxR-like ATPase
MPTLTYRRYNQDFQFTLQDTCRIGRLEGNDVCIPDESISRQHAVIQKVDGRFRLTDLESRNGIVVNGQRVASLSLEEGTRFKLGDIDFCFTLVAPEPEIAMAREEEIARLGQLKEKILDEIARVVIGQKAVLAQVLVAMLARGHCLLVGVPGLAKTLMVRAVGQTVNLLSRRIQFTPDLMPSDITGTNILEEDSATGKRKFRFHHGPLFANLLLADEINRTPPKTQAALLEAMQEHRVTIAGATHNLPDPFMVLATQNPIEQEGTYPLPEAQLDRFMFCIHLRYPSAGEEQRILLDTTRGEAAQLNPVLTAAEVLRFQQIVRQVPVSQHVALYALNLVRATRPESEDAPDCIKRWVRWGAGTRAGQYLLLAAKAHVLLQGRFSVSCADVREFALPVLRHRIFRNFTAASEGVGTDQIVAQILDTIKEPKY